VIQDENWYIGSSLSLRIVEELSDHKH